MQVGNPAAPKGPSRLALAKNVRKLRRRNGWTQEELAHRCQLHTNHIGLIERSEIAITIDTLDLLAKAFGIAPAILLS